MNYLNDFKNALTNRLKLAKIECVFYEVKSTKEYHSFFKAIIPLNVEQYINDFNPVIIKNANKTVKLLNISDFKMIENRFLMFSKINDIELICFDTKNINTANEWNIVNYTNNFLITKTIESYITNKIWAYIDRDREIWKDEEY